MDQSKKMAVRTKGVKMHFPDQLEVGKLQSAKDGCEGRKFMESLLEELLAQRWPNMQAFPKDT